MVFWLCYTFVYSIPKVKKQTFSKLIMYESVATNTTPFVAPYLPKYLKKEKTFTETQKLLKHYE